MFLESAKAALYDEDGHIYAIPTDTAWVSAIFYNKAVFEEYNLKAPTNYEEFLEAVKVLSQEGKIPLALFAKEKWPGLQLYDMIATRENPSGLLGFENDGALTSDEAYYKHLKGVVR